MLLIVLAGAVALGDHLDVDTTPPYVDPLLLNNYDVRPRNRFNIDEGRTLLAELDRLEKDEQQRLTGIYNTLGGIQFG
jgi:hypothetical protein